MALVTLGFDVDKEAAGIDPGTYQFQVSAAELKRATTGSEMVEVQLSVINDPQFTGKSLYDNIVLTPKAAWKLKQFAQAVGVEYRTGIDPEKWVGRTGWCDVIHEEYQNDMRPRVDKYRASA